MSFLSRRKPNPRLRTHAVNIFDGDYEERGSTGGPFEDVYDEEEGWEVSPADAEEDPEDAEMYPDTDSQADMLVQDDALEHHRANQAQRMKWIENAKPPVRVPQIDDRGRAYGLGRRKTATARVWIYPGSGVVTVNKMPFVDYFEREALREDILSPFIVTRTCGQFDVRCYCHGGGKSGQAGAVRLGVARALEKYNPEYRPPMKHKGLMTRDPRMVERKKIGKKKARKAPQWVRR